MCGTLAFRLPLILQQSQFRGPLIQGSRSSKLPEMLASRWLPHLFKYEGAPTLVKSPRGCVHVKRDGERFTFAESPLTVITRQDTTISYRTEITNIPLIRDYDGLHLSRTPQL